MTRDKQTEEQTAAKAAILAGWDSQRRRRDPVAAASCLSDLALDQLQSGELAAADVARATQHLGGCASCRQAASELAEAREQFLAQNIPALAADALARAATAPPPLRPSLVRWRLILPFAGVAAAAMGALLLVPGLLGDRVGAGGQLRSKGSLSLSLFVQHPEQTGPAGVGQLHLGEPLHPGDRVRFQVDSDRDGHLTVLAIDRSGTVSVYHPQPPQGAAAGPGSPSLAPIAARAGVPLSSAVELDGTLGDEVLVAVRCPDPRPVAEVVAATRATFRAGARKDGTGGAQVEPNPGAPPLPLPCAEARYRITKTSANAAPATAPSERR